MGRELRKFCRCSSFDNGMYYGLHRRNRRIIDDVKEIRRGETDVIEVAIGGRGCRRSVMTIYLNTLLALIVNG